MASLNDYKIISQKSKKYFDILSKELSFSDEVNEKEQERLGFYLFILEYLTGKKDISDLTEIITDTEFNKILFGKIFDDCSIDAVNINDEDNIIQLFNFKYRDKFKSGKQKLNESIVSSKFVNAVITKNTDDLKDKIKLSVNNIIDILESNDIWKIVLYIVSNEDFTVDSDPHLARLEEVYGLEVQSIGLNEISDFIALKPKSVDAELILDNDAIMSFSESSISSSKSYIIRLSLSEVIRITCDNKPMREKYNIENISELNNVKLDYSVLFDNVRGFIMKSKFNNNILKTLKNDPTRFFIYNNGLTATVKDISATAINANKRVKVSLRSIQILNGGQTLRTVHNFNLDDTRNIEDYLSNAQILIRVFKVSSDQELINKIAEFTNSQNAISNIDLKSLRSEQLQLEQYLEGHNIIYARKSGDTGSEDNKSYDHKISMEKFGQILISLYGIPEKATNQKKSIFDKYYDDIFGETLKIEEAPSQIKRYFEIKKEYEKTQFQISEQKIFYILYLDKHIIDSLFNLITKFEKFLLWYTSQSDTSEARKLIQIGFKKFIDKQFEIN